MNQTPSVPDPSSHLPPALSRLAELSKNLWWSWTPDAFEVFRRGAVAAVVSRAYKIAMSEPRGPVYLTLPREVLVEAVRDLETDHPREAARLQAGGS